MLQRSAQTALPQLQFKVKRGRLRFAHSRRGKYYRFICVSKMRHAMRQIEFSNKKLLQKELVTGSTGRHIGEAGAHQSASVAFEVVVH